MIAGIYKREPPPKISWHLSSLTVVPQLDHQHPGSSAVQVCHLRTVDFSSQNSCELTLKSDMNVFDLHIQIFDQLTTSRLLSTQRNPKFTFHLEQRSAGHLGYDCWR